MNCDVRTFTAVASGEATAAVARRAAVTAGDARARVVTPAAVDADLGGAAVVVILVRARTVLFVGRRAHALES